MKNQRLQHRSISMCLLFALLSSGLFGAADGAYRVGPKDLLEIEVIELKEMNGKYRVSESGLVTIPILDEFEVGGQSTREIETGLRQLLESRFLQKDRANVSVKILEYRSRPISVVGAVKNAGPLDLSGDWNLIEALTAAGGLAGNYGQALFITRRADNGLTSLVQIPIQPLMFEGDQRLNVPIFAGDMINVPEATEVRISCLGEVASPGSHEFSSTDRITLLSVIAQVGGLGERASGKIIIKRETRSGAIEEISTDYKQIVDGKRNDVPLQDGDVVFVKKSFF